jgi:hypothetical protein
LKHDGRGLRVLRRFGTPAAACDRARFAAAVALSVVMHGHAGRGAERLREAKHAACFGAGLLPLQPLRDSDDDGPDVGETGGIGHGLRRFADARDVEGPERARQEPGFVAHGEPEVTQPEVHA